ncbi:hypothetical protein QBC47DRAFT_218902 [Echria macrotheca]|uniref:Uncharacterized protein n=1 Tax=Echria macrotheca TaxID=438768 RepID=A0AAJ0BCY7_9PEZI|nr:hypothetical protein QBC47DRAFT_218902 [Echria macrotheca]
MQPSIQLNRAFSGIDADLASHTHPCSQPMEFQPQSEAGYFSSSPVQSTTKQQLLCIVSTRYPTSRWRSENAVVNHNLNQPLDTASPCLSPMTSRKQPRRCAQFSANPSRIFAVARTHLCANHTTDNSQIHPLPIASFLAAWTSTRQQRSKTPLRGLHSYFHVNMQFHGPSRRRKRITFDPINASPATAHQDRLLIFVRPFLFVLLTCWLVVTSPIFCAG